MNISLAFDTMMHIKGDEEHHFVNSLTTGPWSGAKQGHDYWVICRFQHVAPHMLATTLVYVQNKQ